MRALISYEFKKNYKRTSLWLFLIITLITNIAYFSLFSMSWMNVYTLNTSTQQLDKHSGLEAIAMNKEIDTYFSGELNKDKLNQIKEYMEKEEISNILSADENKLLMLKYKNQTTLLGKFQRNDGTLRDIQEVYNQNMLPLTLGYSRGWVEFIVHFSNLFSLISPIFIIISTAGIYVNENILGTDKVIYTTKRGRQSLTKTKFLLACAYSTLIYFCFYIFNLLLFAITYGFDGALCSIQSNIVFANSMYYINHLQLAGLMCVTGIIGCIAITSVVLFFSSKLKNITSIICSSLAVIYFPVFFDFSDTIPALNKVLRLMPIFALNIKEGYKHTLLYLGYKIQPMLCMFVSIVITWLLYIIIRKQVYISNK